MVVRTQPANQLPQRRPTSGAFGGQRLGWFRQVARRLAFYWLLVSALLALFSVSLSAYFLSNGGFTTSPEVLFNFATLGVALAISFIVGLLRPHWWRRTIVAAAALPVPMLVSISGNLLAGATVCALLFPLSWLGREIAAQIDDTIDRAEAWVIGIAFGVGLLGLLGLLLGLTGNLRSQLIWPVPVLVTVLLLIRRRDQLHGDATSLITWLVRPGRQRPTVLLFAGIALACLWINLIGALAPEIRSDATRQRLATAVHFAKTGTLNVDPDLNISSTPAMGEITYATAIAAGALQSAKLLHWLMALACTGAIYALGCRLGGRWAGALAAFAFYQTLLVGFLSQTAYLDLFATLFTTVATLCLIIGAGAKWRPTLAAGAFIGLSVVVKLHSGYVAIGLALTVVVLAQQFGWRRIIQHGVILALAAILAAAPWMARSFALTKAIPGVSSATSTLATPATGTSTAKTLLTYDQGEYGMGSSLLRLLTVPFTFVLFSMQFGGWGIADAPISGGHLGFMLLGIVPLVIATRPRRRTLAILGGIIIASLFWFKTMQYIRYALPMIALCCAVGGAAFVAAWRDAKGQGNRIALNILLVILALSGTFVTMHLPTTGQRLAFGMESNEDYLNEWLALNGAGTYQVLQLLSAEPGATRVFALHDGARLYTDVRVSNPWTSGSALAISGSDEEVLARLAAGGYTHIMVDRYFWYDDQWSWDQMTVVNEDFLRRNTELVGGGRYSYLYRILPPERRGTVAWAQGNEVIPNGGFERAEMDRPTGWTLAGSPRVDFTGTQSFTGNGAVALTTNDQMRIDVPVTPNTQYLLAQAARGVEGYGGARISVEWRDANGNVIADEMEKIPVSPLGYRTLSMLVTAPANAATAVIRATVSSSAVWFDDFSMRAVQP